MVLLLSARLVWYVIIRTRKLMSPCTKNKVLLHKLALMATAEASARLTNRLL